MIDCNSEEWRRLQDLSMAVIDLEMDFMAYRNRLEVAKTWRNYYDRVLDLQFRAEDMSYKLSDFLQKVYIEWNECDQKQLLCSFEIIGIPDGMVKTKQDITRILSHVLKVKINESKVRSFDMINTFRVQRAHPICIPTRILAVHMIKRRYCRRVLDLAGHNAHRLYDEPEPIYFNEHLTWVTRKLLRKTTEIANRFGVEFVGIAHGKVYVRKTENSKRHRIRGERKIGRRFCR